MVALATALLSTSPAAWAQDSSTSTTPDAATTLDTVSVLGSRTKPRTVSSSAVPIDIISGEEFRNQGATDALDQLKVLVPSFNVSTIPIDDAASLVRPANLRGLPPDNTLLLVNGKRFHRSAVITFLGHGLSDGAQGPDLSVFPSLALEQVDVLRDGAAAQYGSDAIAGVLNFGLKKLREGGTAEVFAGQYYKGDGLTTQYSAQIGLPLTEHGFATLTAEWRKADDTSRSVQRDDAAAVAAAGYPGVNDPAQIWGSPKVDDDLKLVANLGYNTENVEFYLFGNYAKRKVDGGFYYRDPTARSGVYSNDGGDAAGGQPDRRGQLPFHRPARRRRQPAALQHRKWRRGCAAGQLLHLPLQSARWLHPTLRRRTGGRFGVRWRQGHVGPVVLGRKRLMGPQRY